MSYYGLDIHLDVEFPPHPPIHVFKICSPKCCVNGTKDVEIDPIIVLGGRSLGGDWTRWGY